MVRDPLSPESYLPGSLLLIYLGPAMPLEKMSREGWVSDTKSIDYFSFRSCISDLEPGGSHVFRLVEGYRING